MKRRCGRKTMRAVEEIAFRHIERESLGALPGREEDSAVKVHPPHTKRGVEILVSHNCGTIVVLEREVQIVAENTH
jgi:hypothetical protein